MSGTYKCLISQHNQLFDTTNEIYVKINPSPESVITFENNDIFCPGDSIKILSVNYPQHSYNWFKNNMSILNADSSTIVIYDAAAYYLVLQNKFNCRDTSNILESKLFSKPTLNLGEDKTICEGDSVLLSINNSTYNYLWNTGDTQNDIVVKESGRYFLDIIDENGCGNSDTLIIQVRQNPDIEIGTDTTITFFDCIELYNYNHHSSLKYLWNNSFQGYSYYFCGNYSDQPQDHLISVIASDELGCFSKDSVTIKVVFKINENGEPFNTPLLFPNVTSSRDIFLFLPEIYLNSDSKVEIYSNNGELLSLIHLSEKYPSILELNLSSFSYGVFYFAISNKTSRIIKELSLIP